jgi:multiple sugar transport system substrate-binding protein
MNKKRWAALVAFTAIAATVLAGCSATPDSKPAKSDGPVTLNYWDFIDPTQDNPRAQALKENLANFETANPDIKVNLSVVSLGDMLSRLPQAAAAGTAPDVFKMFSPVVPQMAAAGAYSPLPEAASKVTDWLRPTSNLAGPDGKQVAEPYEYRACVLYYNQKILDQIGETVPTTYDQVVEVAKKAAAAGYTGFGTGFSDTDNAAIIGTFFDCFMTQTGQQLQKDGKYDFATKKGAEFGNFLTGLRDAKALGKNVVSDSYGSVADGLANGTVAMAVLGTERILTFSKTAPDVKWASLPTASTGDKTGTTFGWTLGIGAGSKHVDAAWKFIEYMTGPKAGAVMATGGEVPTRAATYKESYFSTPEAKITNTIADYLKSNSKPRNYPNNWNTLAQGLANAGQSLVLNGSSGTEFIKSAQDSANKK